ncbi:hypothetical protein [Methylohalobius crimeensis]|nr:hypothetical protein [Methylohalobius crimeensis]
MLKIVTLEGSHWQSLSALKDDDPVRQPPFEAVEFSLGNLWV